MFYSSCRQLLEVAVGDVKSTGGGPTSQHSQLSTVSNSVCYSRSVIASFPGLLIIQFLIACSMQKQREAAGLFYVGGVPG